MDDYLLISGIQHFSFCRRQWALIHIDNQWEENALTAEGRAMHERVHNNRIITKRNGVITLRAVPISSEKMMISGQCDAIELIPDDNGIEIYGRSGKWRIHPVEYKRGRSKSDNCDRLQLTAECMCLEEMLTCSIYTGSLFYGQTGHREEVTIDMALRSQLQAMLSEMREYYERSYVPKVKPSKKCKNCSLSNACLPKLMRKTAVNSYIESHIQDCLL